MPEYEHAAALLATLTDVRFKLLAFVPTIAGAAVALLGRGAAPSELLAVGMLGLAATAGVVLYELHNTELYEHVLRRAEELEGQLGLRLLRDRPHHRRDRPLAVVYAAALGAWAYVVAWGALAAAAVGDARPVGGGIGAVVSVAAAWLLLDREQGAQAPAASRAEPI